MSTKKGELDRAEEKSPDGDKPPRSTVGIKPLLTRKVAEIESPMRVYSDGTTGTWSADSESAQVKLHISHF